MANFPHPLPETGQNVLVIWTFHAKNSLNESKSFLIYYFYYHPIKKYFLIHCNLFVDDALLRTMLLIFQRFGDFNCQCHPAKDSQVNICD